MGPRRGLLLKLFHTFCSVQPECSTVPLNRHMASSAQTSWSVLQVPALRELRTERFPSYEAVKCHFVCMFSKCLKDWNKMKWSEDVFVPIVSCTGTLGNDMMQKS